MFTITGVYCKPYNSNKLKNQLSKDNNNCITNKKTQLAKNNFLHNNLISDDFLFKIDYNHLMGLTNI